MNAPLVLDKLMVVFKFYKVNQTLLFFEKLSNGYAINAIIGKRKLRDVRKKHLLAVLFGLKE